ncbi:MAG: peptidase S1 [Sandaracinaceae bacterium]
MRIRSLVATVGAAALAVGLLSASAVAVAQLTIGQSNSNFGRGQLNGGFMPDPFAVAITSGGGLDASSMNLAPGCRGYVTQRPDYILNYSNPASFLRFYFVAAGNGDTTLVINDANGRWHCNDDSYGLNPGIDLRNPPQGQYDIWVGSYASGQNIRGQLYVTEMQSQRP